MYMYTVQMVCSNILYVFWVIQLRAGLYEPRPSQVNYVRPVDPNRKLGCSSSNKYCNCGAVPDHCEQGSDKVTVIAISSTFKVCYQHINNLIVSYRL